MASKYVLSFDGLNDWVELPSAAIPVGNAITCSFWAYGGDALPAKNSVLAALEANGKRVLNIHLPWSNGSIYFDCGNNGSHFDRIEKQAQPIDYKGKWSHWAFTKDAATGEMKIYLNGQLWHSGTGKTFALPKSDLLRLGCYGTGGLFYQGKLAEVQFWNRALTQAEIQQGMSRALTGNEPGLVSYWPLNEGSGNIVHDNKTNAVNHGAIQGSTEVSWVVSNLSIAPAGASQPEIVAPNPPARSPSRQAVLVLAKNHPPIAVGSGALRPKGRFTIEAWVNPATNAGKQVIFADGETRFYLEGGELKFQATPTTEAIASSGAGIEAGNWYHVAVSLAGNRPGDTKLYINGVANDNKVAISPVFALGDTYLGGQPDLPDSGFQGKLLEVRVWRFARSRSEIEAHRLYPLTGKELGLVRCWSFDETFGAILHDRTTLRAVGAIAKNAVREEVDIPLKLKLEPQERLVRSTGLEDYGYWWSEMSKQQKTEAEPHFRRGRIWA